MYTFRHGLLLPLLLLVSCFLNVRADSLEFLASKQGEDKRVMYRDEMGQSWIIPHVPPFFERLDENRILQELKYWLSHEEWSERVILMKLLFQLSWGYAGWPDVGLSNAIPQYSAIKPLGWDSFLQSKSVCSWKGMTCTQGKLEYVLLPKMDLMGTLSDDWAELTNLRFLDLQGNSLHGTIPSSLAQMSNLVHLNLAVNRLEGTIPKSLGTMSQLNLLFLSLNRLTGTVPKNLFKLPDMVSLDLAVNHLEGTMPTVESPALTALYLKQNKFTGSLPQDASFLQNVEQLHLEQNQFTGSIPVSWWDNLRSVTHLGFAENQFTGTLPAQMLQLTALIEFTLHDNQLQGTFPRGDQVPESLLGSEDVSQYHGRYANFTSLVFLDLSQNNFSGPLPPEVLFASTNSLASLDIANNSFTGSIPSVIGKCKKLKWFNAEKNRFTGSLPTSMNKMDPNLNLNLTDNLLVGTVPKLFCGGGAMSQNILFRQFGCDAILCPAGTFHPSGAATMEAGCRPCPSSGDDTDDMLSQVVGRTHCPGVESINGDLDGDGKLSEREILRLLWSYTIGRNWGSQFQSWADPRIDSCDLFGITCIHGRVARIDLSEASLCSNGARKQGNKAECKGIPAELSLLSDLEVLNMNKRQFLYGSIPTEFGRLSKLLYLDIGNSPNIAGTIPTELGQLSELRFLNLAGCHFYGTVPESLYRLTHLEKLHLSNNMLAGTISSQIRKLTKLKELVWSRTSLGGTLPDELGELSLLENLEIYGNRLVGSIPATIGGCTSLKRIDLFNNNLTGPLPSSMEMLTSLQIFHCKQNSLTGTIPEEFGDLPRLAWFDVSTNKLHGTAPASFGKSKTITDFRLGENMIHDPIPQSLCTNRGINGGLTRTYGCDGVLCPAGTYSDPGHATHTNGCTPCPKGTTTLYLGSSSCQEMTDADILAIFFNVMGEQGSKGLQSGHWKDPEGPVCGWNGVECDENGEISSIQFPLAGLDPPVAT
eukprot:Nitzschia sp. Nitz4//scaffold202_size38995//17650//21009//NITZ4_007631-RA/size38995-augustus-gene-0.51-mRNA-1//1//CDS//3329541381//2383//frame0